MGSQVFKPEKDFKLDFKKKEKNLVEKYNSGKEKVDYMKMVEEVRDVVMKGKSKKKKVKPSNGKREDQNGNGVGEQEPEIIDLKSEMAKDWAELVKDSKRLVGYSGIIKE